MEYNQQFMEHAFKLALEAEAKANLPIGALITDGQRIITEGRNGVMSPSFHPGRHAELEALTKLDDQDIARLGELAMYVTLEPCLMCLGSAVLHRIKIIFYATEDPDRGATYLLPQIAERYPKKYLPILRGPMLPERGSILFERAKTIYRTVRPAI